MPEAMVKHILVKDKNLAEKLNQQLAKGGDFSKLAKQHSTCPSGKKGGDLGEVRPGQLVKSVNDVVFKKPLRKVHGPVKSKFGYHLIYTYFRD